MRTIIATKVKTAVKGADRHAYTTINKWKAYIEKAVNPKFPSEVTSPEEILDAVK